MQPRPHTVAASATYGSRQCAELLAAAEEAGMYQVRVRVRVRVRVKVRVRVSQARLPDGVGEVVELLGALSVVVLDLVRLVQVLLRAV